MLGGIGRDHLDSVGQADLFEACAGTGGHSFVDVDADYRAGGADQVGEHRGIRAAGPDLQHTLT
jgi:hypothetical protein